MTGLIEILVQGGPVVFLLLALSVISWLLIVFKAIEMIGTGSGEKSRRRAFEAMENGQADVARNQFHAGRSPADRLSARAVELMQSGTARDQIEAELEWRAGEEQGHLHRFIRPLELIATASPLLGLLGTVLGMIEAFRDLSLAEGAANASLLADGIWQALLTTAAGLIVAIPALVASTIFSERAERATKNIETALGELLCDPAFAN